METTPLKLKVGDKFRVRNDQHQPFKEHLKGQWLTIVELSEEPWEYSFFDCLPHYRVKWLQEDNPDRNSVLRRNVISNYWYDDDYDLFRSSTTIQKPYSETLPLV